MQEVTTHRKMRTTRLCQWLVLLRVEVRHLHRWVHMCIGVHGVHARMGVNTQVCMCVHACIWVLSTVNHMQHEMTIDLAQINELTTLAIQPLN